MRRATCFPSWKPATRTRKGLRPVTAPGSTARGMWGEKRTGTWETRRRPRPRGRGRACRAKREGGTKRRRESDRLIVLRDGRADHTGKGAAGLRSPQRKQARADMKGCQINTANLTAGNSEAATTRPFHGGALKTECKASSSEEPGAGIPHAGICAGGARQRASLPRYLGDPPPSAPARAR